MYERSCNQSPPLPLLHQRRSRSPEPHESIEVERRSENRGPRMLMPQAWNRAGPEHSQIDHDIDPNQQIGGRIRQRRRPDGGPPPGSAAGLLLQLGNLDQRSVAFVQNGVNGREIGLGRVQDGMETSFRPLAYADAPAVQARCVREPRFPPCLPPVWRSSPASTESWRQRHRRSPRLPG